MRQHRTEKRCTVALLCDAQHLLEFPRCGKALKPAKAFTERCSHRSRKTSKHRLLERNATLSTLSTFPTHQKKRPATFVAGLSVHVGTVFNIPSQGGRIESQDAPESLLSSRTRQPAIGRVPGSTRSRSPFAGADTGLTRSRCWFHRASSRPKPALSIHNCCFFNSGVSLSL